MPNLARVPIPKMVTLPDCDFPLIEGSVNGYKTLHLPEELRRYFIEGAHAVRILSLRLAATIPDFEGRTSGKFSLLPHRDHFGDTGAPHRYLTLTKHSPGKRGATTLAFLDEAAPHVLRVEESFFNVPGFRVAAGAERSYDARFKISELQYDRCFDTEHGYEEVVAEMLLPGATPAQHISTRLNVLDYLIRGPLADTVMRDIRKECGSMLLSESWEEGGLLILDNARVFHARDGGSDPLQRNFCE